MQLSALHIFYTALLAYALTTSAYAATPEEQASISGERAPILEDQEQGIVVEAVDQSTASGQEAAALKESAIMPEERIEILQEQARDIAVTAVAQLRASEEIAAALVEPAITPEERTSILHEEIQDIAVAAVAHTVATAVLQDVAKLVKYAIISYNLLADIEHCRQEKLRGLENYKVHFESEQFEQAVINRQSVYDRLRYMKRLIDSIDIKVLLANEEVTAVVMSASSGRMTDAEDVSAKVLPETFLNIL